MPKFLSFILLAVLAVVGLGAATLGVVQSKSATSLSVAVSNTLKAPSYTEYLAERTPQGDQTAYLNYQAPDRLGGWLESSGRRTYLVIIGSTEYISVTRPIKGAKGPIVFYKQETEGAQAVDPAHTYLQYYDKGKSTKSGSVTTVTLSQGGETEKLIYTVTGNYVSNFKAVTPGGTINLSISNVGSASKVALPSGAKFASSPPATSATAG
jgi:hypothetical protein